MKVPASQRVMEFACHSKDCAPPPTGTGGSRRRGKRATDPRTNYMRELLNRRRATRAERKADGRKVHEIISRYLDQTKTRMAKGTTPLSYATLDKTRQLAFALDKRVRIRHTWRMTAEFSNTCHGPHDGKFCGPQGAATPGPDPQKLGRPHFTESTHAGMYHTWDEKGRGGGMSGLEQAKRFVKGRETTLKRMKTQRRAAPAPTVKIAVRDAQPGQKVLFGKSGLDVSPMTSTHEYIRGAPPLKGEFTIRNVEPYRGGVSSGMSKKSATAYHVEVEDTNGDRHHTRFSSQAKLTIIA